MKKKKLLVANETGNAAKRDDACAKLVHHLNNACNQPVISYFYLVFKSHHKCLS